MAGEIIRDKILKNLIIKEKGVHKVGLLSFYDQKGFILMDLTISKRGEGRVQAVVSDGQKEFLLLETKESKSYSFPSGLNFWREAELEIVVEEDEYVIVTCGYLVNDLAKDRTTWGI